MIYIKANIKRKTAQVCYAIYWWFVWIVTISLVTNPLFFFFFWQPSFTAHWPSKLTYPKSNIADGQQLNLLSARINKDVSLFGLQAVPPWTYVHSYAPTAHLGHDFPADIEAESMLIDATFRFSLSFHSTAMSQLTQQKCKYIA